MIIETKDDVVRLSGGLNKNQWMAIRAAAGILLENHPEGIIIDCSALEHVSPEGARTFSEAMRDIEMAGTRIIVANVPDAVLNVVRSIPGIRSQLPVASSIEEARATLRMCVIGKVPAKQIKSGCCILVPLLAEVDLSYGATLAARMAPAMRAEVKLVYFLEVARTLPLQTPLPEAEQAARAGLEAARQAVRTPNIAATQQVERVRDAAEGILGAVRTLDAAMVVLGATSEPEGGVEHDRFHQLVDMLLHRSPVEVVIGRMAPRP